jgi:Tfp pilus assembly protein PilO
MKTSTKRILSIGFAGLFFIGTLVVYASFLKPALDKVLEQRSVIVSKTMLFNNQRSAVSQVQKLVSQFQSIAKLQEAVSLAMPMSENTTDALNQIQAITRSAQVNLKSISIAAGSFEPSRQPLVKRLGSLSVNATVEGGYENIKKFLAALETNVRVANIRTFSLALVPGPAELYSLNLTVDIYYQE